MLISLLVTMFDGVVVCMLVRLLGVDVWNGVEVGVDAAASRSWLTWSASGMVGMSPRSPRHLDWNRHVAPPASIEPVDRTC